MTTTALNIPMTDSACDENIRRRLRSVFGNMSFAAVGRVTHFHRETVRRYMTTVPPPLTFIRAVCEHFGISANWLILGIEPCKFNEVSSSTMKHAPINELFAEVGRRLEQLGTGEQVQHSEPPASHGDGNHRCN